MTDPELEDRLRDWMASATRKPVAPGAFVSQLRSRMQEPGLRRTRTMSPLRLLAAAVAAIAVLGAVVLSVPRGAPVPATGADSPATGADSPAPASTEVVTLSPIGGQTRSGSPSAPPSPTDAPGFSPTSLPAEVQLVQAPTETDTTLRIRVREEACANGASAEGRIVVEKISYGSDRIAVTVGVEPAGGDCPSNPWTPFVIELTEPVGVREVQVCSVPGDRPSCTPVVRPATSPSASAPGDPSVAELLLQQGGSQCLSGAFVDFTGEPAPYQRLVDQPGGEEGLLPDGGSYLGRFEDAVAAMGGEPIPGNAPWYIKRHDERDVLVAGIPRGSLIAIQLVRIDLQDGRTVWTQGSFEAAVPCGR